MPSNHLILCHPVLLLPSIFPNIRVFSNNSVLHISCPKYWSFSFNISPSDEYSGLVSFRMDWLDLLAVQGTPRVFPKKFKCINSSPLSFLYGPTLISIHDYWKNHSSDHTDVCWQSDFSAFNILCRFVIAFLPRIKHLSTSWLQSLSTVISEPRKIVSHYFHCFPIYLP